MKREHTAGIAGRFEKLQNTGNTAIYDEIYPTQPVHHAHSDAACTAVASCRHWVLKTRAGMPDFRLTVEVAIVHP
jgi:hypothetical protein